MKKSLLVLTVALLSLGVLLSGCGGTSSSGSGTPSGSTNTTAGAIASLGIASPTGPSSVTSSSPIVGAWRDSKNEKIVWTFFADGKFDVNDTAAGTFTFEGGKVTISHPNGAVRVYDVSIAGDTLTLDAPDSKMILNKVK